VKLLRVIKEGKGRALGLLEVELKYHACTGAGNTKCNQGKEYGRLRVHYRQATKNLHMRAWKTAGL